MSNPLVISTNDKEAYQNMISEKRDSNLSEVKQMKRKKLAGESADCSRDEYISMEGSH